VHGRPPEGGLVVQSGTVKAVGTFRVVPGPFGEITQAIGCVLLYLGSTLSALRVSHSLSGLLPPELRGSVSRRIRP